MVSTFVGAFGGSYRETRLTALLGYLIALQPGPFLRLFGFAGKPRVVRLENWHGDTRSDIFVETTVGTGVIEAKVDATDPLEQSRKYQARWTVLLTQHFPSSRQREWRRTKYLSWQQLAGLLKGLAHSKNPSVRFVSRDLCRYLEENHMIKQRESVEIYAREINEPVTLALFLKAQMYGCWYEEGSRLPEALYFAPHFGQNIAYEHPGVHVGISYIARIERVEVVETWQELMNAIVSIRGKHWLNSHLHEIKPLKTAPTWEWRSRKKRSFLFLSIPRLVFNPPLHKEKLQKGKGWLSKRFLSFEQLFSAWGC